MKYQEFLARISDGQALSYLGRLHGLDLSPRQPPAKMREQLCARLANLAYLESYIRELPEIEQMGLMVTAFGHKDLFPATDSVHRRLNELNQKTGRTGGRIMASLLNRGLVFTGRDQSYQDLYILPDEVLLVIFRLVAQRHAVPNQPSLPEEPACGFDILSVLNELTLFLGWLRREPVRLTQAGYIYRRDQQKLLACFNPPTVADSDHERPYPPRLDFLLAFCDMNELIEPFSDAAGNAYLGVTPRADRWMQKNLNRQAVEVFEFLHRRLERLHGSLPWTLLALGSMVPNKGWLNLSTLIAFLAECAADRWYLPERELPRAVKWLVSFGLVEEAFLNGQRLIRLTVSGSRFRSSLLPHIRQDNKFLVQPNYEVLVPQELKPQIRWKLEAYTDLVKNDRIIVLKISEESVYRAFKRGFAPEELLPFLEKFARTPLPENVVYSLKDWCDRYGALYLEQPLLLACRTQELAAEIAADPRFKPYLCGEFTPRHLRVDPARWGELLAALEAAGYRPRPGIARDEAVKEAKGRLREVEEEE